MFFFYLNRLLVREISGLFELFLEIVGCLLCLGACRGGLVADKVACRVTLENLWPSLLVVANEDHGCKNVINFSVGFNGVKHHVQTPSGRMYAYCVYTWLMLATRLAN